jgi:hypothetical protein
MDEKLLSRVKRMEKSYDKVSAAATELAGALDAFDRLQADIRRLEKYQSSGQWLGDYEADERGEIPSGTKRGVLSEDGLYNLLSDIDALRERLGK